MEEEELCATGKGKESDAVIRRRRDRCWAEKITMATPRLYYVRI